MTETPRDPHPPAPSPYQTSKSDIMRCPAPYGLSRSEKPLPPTYTEVAGTSGLKSVVISRSPLRDLSDSAD